MTRTASLAVSASSSVSACSYRFAGASPAISTGFARDQIGGSVASSRFNMSGETAASDPPRSTKRSTARTPMPPPLVRMARRLPGNGLSDRALRRPQTTRRDQIRAKARRDGMRRRKPHPSPRALRYGSRGFRSLRVASGLDDHHRLTRAAARAADMNLRVSLMDSTYIRIARVLWSSAK